MNFCWRPLRAVIVLLCVSSAGFAQQSPAPDGSDYIAALQSLAASPPVAHSMARSRDSAATPRLAFEPLRNVGTVGIPSGFALPGRTAFVAGSLSDTRERHTRGDPDGSLALGFGLGDAARGVGFETIVAVSSVHPSDFGDSGSLNFKLSRQVASPFTNGTASVALGVSNTAPWGDSTVQDAGYYAIGSSTFRLSTGGAGLPGMISIGYGTNIGTFEDMDGALFGLGVGLGDWASAGVSWYGNELIVGANTGVRLTPKTSVQLGLSFSDATQRNSDGRWVLNVALVSSNLFK